MRTSLYIYDGQLHAGYRSFPTCAPHRAHQFFCAGRQFPDLVSAFSDGRDPVSFSVLLPVWKSRFSGTSARLGDQPAQSGRTRIVRACWGCWGSAHRTPSRLLCGTRTVVSAVLVRSLHVYPRPARRGRFSGGSHSRDRTVNCICRQHPARRLGTLCGQRVRQSAPSAVRGRAASAAALPVPAAAARGAPAAPSEDGHGRASCGQTPGCLLLPGCSVPRC